MKAGDNPFRTERLERVRFRLPAGGSWDGLLTRLRALNFRVAITGPHGSGKTTFLDHLAPRLEKEGYRVRRAKLDVDRRQLAEDEVAGLLSGLGPRDLVFLDGAEQLSALQWWRFRRAVRGAGGLVITTHRPGRLPTLIDFRPSPRLLEELVDELCPEFRLASGLDPTRLFAAHAGNLRHALLACYDDCAGR